jgi:hypothetical protein
MHLRDVRRSHVQALVDRLAAEQLSESRIRSVVSAIRALYGYAIEQGYVEFSPAEGLAILRENAPVWAPEEAGPERTPGETEPSFDWTDDLPPETGPAPPPPDRRAPRKDGRGSEYQPIALLPERILSLVLRIVVVVFIMFALITLAGSVGGA